MLMLIRLLGEYKQAVGYGYWPLCLIELTSKPALSLFFVCGKGPRSRSYGRTTALKLIVQPLWWRWREGWSFFFVIFPSNGATVERNWQRRTEVLGDKPVPVPLCPPQIPRVTVPGSNPYLRVGRPATNRLRYGAACLIICFVYWLTVACVSNW